MLDPIEPPRVDEAKIEEIVDLTREVLHELQTGALSLGDKEALGAKDITHFRDCLKRSYLDGPGANIAHAQTTVEEARKQNLARQADGVQRTKELFLKPEPISVWSDILQPRDQEDTDNDSLLLLRLMAGAPLVLLRTPRGRQDLLNEPECQEVFYNMANQSSQRLAESNALRPVPTGPMCGQADSHRH